MQFWGVLGWVQIDFSAILGSLWVGWDYFSAILGSPWWVGIDFSAVLGSPWVGWD